MIINYKDDSYVFRENTSLTDGFQLEINKKEKYILQLKYKESLQDGNMLLCSTINDLFYKGKIANGVCVDHPEKKSLHQLLKEAS
jgi:hypothetical protein